MCKCSTYFEFVNMSEPGFSGLSDFQDWEFGLPSVIIELDIIGVSIERIP